MTHTIYTYNNQDNWYYIKEVKTSFQVNELIYNLVVELEKLRTERNIYDKQSPELVAFCFGKDINGRKLREGKRKDKLKVAYSTLVQNSQNLFGDRIKEITNILRDNNIITGSLINDIIMEISVVDRDIVGLKDTFRD